MSYMKDQYNSRAQNVNSFPGSSLYLSLYLDQGHALRQNALLGKQTGLWLKDFYINFSKQYLDWPVVLFKTKHPTAKDKNIFGRCSSKLEKLRNSC